jgi:dipeptidyl aminopeptidase/acylaminoacyl peptidase
MGRSIWPILLSCLVTAGCASVATVAPRDLDTLPTATTRRILFDSAGGHAEAYVMRPKAKQPVPLMVLLHGHSWIGIGARRLLPTANTFASELCYATMAVSLPGYGDTQTVGSTEETTRTVVLDAVRLAKTLPWVDAERVYVYGFSRGAVVATALINQIESVKGIVLSAGAYDLPRLYRDTQSIWIRKLLNPNGDAAPKLQNYLPETERWTAPTLILHGTADGMIPVSQATLLRDQLDHLGKPYQLVLLPDRGHWLRIDAIKEPMLNFLRAHGGSACPVNDP